MSGPSSYRCPHVEVVYAVSVICMTGQDLIESAHRKATVKCKLAFGLLKVFMI